MEFPDAEFATHAAARLEERRLAMVEDRLDADLALGHQGSVVSELQGLVGRFPLRERFRAQLALALYRSGRQAEALRSLADAATTFREELGIEPGRALRDLESAILEHDPTLDPPTPPPVPSPAAPSVATARSGASPSHQGPERPAVGTTDLAGRTSELSTLLGAFADARRDAQFVVIEGEPGIGKTRLAEELRRRVAADGDDGTSIAAWGRSDEGGAAPALWPWLPPLRQARGTRCRDPAGARRAAHGRGRRWSPARRRRRSSSGSTRSPTCSRTPDVTSPWSSCSTTSSGPTTRRSELLGFLAGRLRRAR